MNMELYQSLQNGLKPSVHKKRGGSVFVILALMVFYASQTAMAFFSVFDVVYALFLFFLGIVMLIAGRGYCFFRRLYLVISNDGFDLKVDRVKHQVLWSDVDRLRLTRQRLSVSLKSGTSLHISLLHLNPQCVDYLKQLFSDVTWEEKIPITFS